MATRLVFYINSDTRERRIESGCLKTKTRHCYVLRTLPVLLALVLLSQQVNKELLLFVTTVIALQNMCVCVCV